MACLKYANMPFSVLITGASRGVGYEFVKQFVNIKNSPRYVFAACRDPKKFKFDSCPAVLYPMKLDLKNKEDFTAAKGFINTTTRGRGLSCIINCARVNYMTGFLNQNPQQLDEHFRVNLLGPIYLTRIMSSLLETNADQEHDNKTGEEFSMKRGAVFSVSPLQATYTLPFSQKGERAFCYGYNMSKCGLLHFHRSLAREFRKKGIASMNLYPGIVGKESASLEEVVAGLIKEMLDLKVDDNGQFMASDHSHRCYIPENFPPPEESLSRKVAKGPKYC